MAQEMRTQMIQSMRAHAEGHIQKHKANVEIYLNQPGGSGGQGDVLETIEKELNIIAMYHDQLEMLNTYFAPPKVLYPNLFSKVRP